MSVVGIVLAAGESRRMGQPKQLLEFSGSTMLNTTIDTYRQSSVDRVTVVLGSSADAIEPTIPFDDVTVVRNEGWQRGNVSSLRVGFAAAGSFDACVTGPGDMPELAHQTIDLLVDAWRHEEVWAAVPEYRDRVAHPILLSAAAAASAVEHDETRGVWKRVVQDETGRVRRVPVGTNAPADINTQADYARLTGSEPGSL